MSNINLLSITIFNVDMFNLYIEALEDQIIKHVKGSETTFNNQFFDASQMILTSLLVLPLCLTKDFHKNKVCFPSAIFYILSTLFTLKFSSDHWIRASYTTPCWLNLSYWFHWHCYQAKWRLSSQSYMSRISDVKFESTVQSATDKPDLLRLDLLSSHLLAPTL